jgi:hypothetical protein
MGNKTDQINVYDLKEIQRWMRELNVSKEELLKAVEKFGSSAEAVSLGLNQGASRVIH